MSLKTIVLPHGNVHKIANEFEDFWRRYASRIQTYYETEVYTVAERNEPEKVGYFITPCPPATFRAAPEKRDYYARLQITTRLRDDKPKLSFEINQGGISRQQEIILKVTFVSFLDYLYPDTKLKLEDLLPPTREWNSANDWVCAEIKRGRAASDLHAEWQERTRASCPDRSKEEMDTSAYTFTTEVIPHCRLADDYWAYAELKSYRVPDEIFVQWLERIGALKAELPDPWASFTLAFNFCWQADLGRPLQIQAKPAITEEPPPVQDKSMTTEELSPIQEKSGVPRGRPLTDEEGWALREETVEKVEELHSKGKPYEIAVELQGISYSTFNRWKKQLKDRAAASKK